jgi:hypothetical protein
MIGTRLGPYEITAKLGESGMDAMDCRQPVIRLPAI